MSKILEAAEKYAEVVYWTTENESFELIEAFKKGAEFAQQWIPITKEFPYGECLLQNDKGKNSYFDFTGASDSDIQFFLVENCTEKWRPVSFL